MKRKFLMFLTLLLSIVLYSSCKNGWYSHDNYDTSDSAAVAEYVNSVVDPSIMDASEALSLKNHMLDANAVDSVFTSLSDNTLINIASVLKKKKTNGFHKVDIVNEFQRCRDVYTNLPKNSSSKDTIKLVDKTGTDLGSRPTGVISNSYSFRTDTIEGKPVRIKIQTIESYEN